MKRSVLRRLTGAFILLSSVLLFSTISPSYAAIETYQFDSLEQEQTFNTLIEQLRCPKCQNNNIAESNAVIATDMRAKAYELVKSGYSKQQVIDYMVDRYGYFVTYDPPITKATIILWLSPALFILLGISWILYNTYRRRQRSSTPTEQELAQLQQLLADKPKPSSGGSR